MFCPLKGSGVSPRRRKTRHSAAVISDLPAPLDVPSTIKGGACAGVVIAAASSVSGNDACVRSDQLVAMASLVTAQAIDDREV
ncbi:MAG: Uncharacterised protein [Prochlorococcus marinus str. MIT 9215]|nr:MAG: Uncharacterised protein [Prochlorococcus marinus str. MIT 9215]